jgi:glycosyltransferase involved in cell wall biosynthesis
MTSPSDTVVLFFSSYREGDRFLPYDRYLRRVVKPVYKRLVGQPATTGFDVWFSSLVLGLERIGQRVVVNDRRSALRNPDHPIGLAGYPEVLDRWQLPNPAVLGPGLYDHPAVNPSLMDDPRYVFYLTTCDWVDAMFRQVYGDACVRWFGGIDTERWPDARGHEKRYDVIVYDKIRWDRERLVPVLLDPILEDLHRRGLSTTVVRYGDYHHATYRQLLKESRAMVFLCEHETQGMAYQEALASGLPVLAWDPGTWLDPRRATYTSDPVPATSVPYFSPECGERFQGPDDRDETLDLFLSRLGEYTPRDYVRRELSLERSAEVYLEHYRRAGEASTAGG